MAIELGVLGTYVAVSEADNYLENSTNWNAATDEDKFDALLDSRYYIDVNFNCDLSTYDVIPDELKYANAVLADDLIKTPGLFDHAPAVKLKKVKAGSVSSEVEYTSGSKPTPPSLNKVKGILKNICTQSNLSSGIIDLIRA